jgi:hypothetical protein
MNRKHAYQPRKRKKISDGLLLQKVEEQQAELGIYRETLETVFGKTYACALLSESFPAPEALRTSIEEWRKRTGCEADDTDQVDLERSIQSREQDLESTFSSLSFSTTTKMQNLSGRADVKQWLNLLSCSDELTMQYAQGLHDAGFEDVEALM